MNQPPTAGTAGKAPLDLSGAFLRQRSGPDRASEDRERTSPQAKLQVLVVCMAAFAASIVTTASHGSARYDWKTFVALAAAAAIAQLFVVQTTHNQSYHLAIVFVVAAALLLPPELVAALCLIQHVPEWIRERYPPEIQGFNIANYTLAALGAWTGADTVLGSHAAGPDLRTALAGVVAGAVFVGFNHGVLAGMLRVARGHSMRETGLFSLESLSTDFVLALMGVGLAAWGHSSLAFIPIAVAPLILIHRALSIPRLRAEASRDTKTGLFNAGHLNDALAEEMDRAARFNRPLSVIVADLDLLRKINNTYGHLTGDAVLQGVARTFRVELRPYDVAARFGGEEFAVLLPETEFDEAMAIAERIRSSFAEERFERAGSDEQVAATVSIGVASFPLHATHADELVHQADLALYRSKALGRNRVCGATAETLALNKLLLDTGARSTERPEGTTPRGFRPYGADRSLEKSAGRVSRLLKTMRGLSARMRLALVGEAPEEGGSRAERRVRKLIGMLSLGAAALLAVSAHHLLHIDPFAFLAFATVVLALQLLAVDLYGTGAEAGSAIGILAGGFVLGPPAGIALAVLAASAQWIRRRGLLHRALFDCANLAIAAAAATYSYQSIVDLSDSIGVRLMGAIAATVAYKAINSGLLCLAMSIAESLPFSTVWNERFRWAGVHYFAFGPLAFASALAYERMGVVGLMAFAVPPVLVTISVRQYLKHTRASVDEVRRANEELRRSNDELAESTQRVRRTHLATIAALSRSMEAKDHYTGGHTERVAALAVALARRLGYRGEELDAIEVGALLHDIGKIGIPESVLHKTGRLTEEEWGVMREHPVISDYILSEVDLHPFVRQIARWSHERIDGQGYPDGLAGETIPLPARIALVADAFDALVSDRPYRPGRNVLDALAELQAHAGTQFCPLVIHALEEIAREEPQVLGERHLRVVA